MAHRLDPAAKTSFGKVFVPARGSGVYLSTRPRVRRWLDRLGFVGFSSSVFTWGLVRGLQGVTLRLDLFVVLIVLVVVAALDPPVVALLPTASLAIPLAVVSSVAFTVRVHDAAIGAVDGIGWGWLFVPLVVPLYTLAAVKAVSEYPLSWNGEWYHVDKST